MDAREHAVAKPTVSGAGGLAIGGLGWAMNQYGVDVPWFVPPLVVAISTFLLGYAVYGYGKIVWGAIGPKVRDLARHLPGLWAGDVSQRLYVGDITIDANRLGSDYVITFALRIFNATGRTMVARSLHGAIGYQVQSWFRPWRVHNAAGWPVRR